MSDTETPTICLDVALLERVGTALYGSQWQREMARDLGVNDRSLRRWVAGDRALPDRIWPELLELLEERDTEIAELEATLTVAIKQMEGE